MDGQMTSNESSQRTSATTPAHEPMITSTAMQTVASTISTTTAFASGGRARALFIVVCVGVADGLAQVGGRRHLVLEQADELCRFVGRG